MDNFNDGIQINKSFDGIYLVLNKSKSKTGAISFADVMCVIEKSGVQDLDLAAISAACDSKDKMITVKISNNSVLGPVNETFNIDITRDKMAATITFYPPQNDGVFVNFDDIKAEIINKGIVFGVDYPLLEKLIKNKNYATAYVFANGLAPVNGKDGKLVFYFNTQEKSLKPKSIDGGKVDFRELGLIELAKCGQKLITLIPPTEGSPGKNVLGIEISNLKGKQVKLPFGKGVTVSPDGLEVYSEIDGQIVFTSNKISVLPVYEVRGNVDNSIGNIRFLGTVIVHGNVLTGFSIISSGTVEIFGVVEGATIHSDEDIIIHSGVQGLGKCKLTAAGDIKAKYIENCTLNAGHNITADAIMHSDVRCGNKLSVMGRKGLLVGGTFMVGEEVSAKVIGSQMSTLTEIEVGFEIGVYDKYNSLKKTLTTLKTELNGLDQIIENLIKIRTANQLTDSKKSILIKSIRSKSFLLEKIASTQKEIESIAQLLERNRGIVKAENIIHPGVKVTIGNAIMYIREDIRFCKLYNEQAEIKIGSYS